VPIYQALTQIPDTLATDEGCNQLLLFDQ
jgi:hypothetical protein